MIIDFLQVDHQIPKVLYQIIRNQHEFNTFLYVKVLEPLVGGFRP